MDRISNEQTGDNELTKCLNHSICGAYCESICEEQTLCAGCIHEFHEKALHAYDMARLREQVSQLELDCESWKRIAENHIEEAGSKGQTIEKLRAQLTVTEQLATDAVTSLAEVTNALKALRQAEVKKPWYHLVTPIWLWR
jgi:hypothetical protein